MKNSIAFVFTKGPHGLAAAREGLDALLATLSLSKKIGIFFISDGVLLLLPGQKPSHILGRDFISTFGVLKFYNIKYVLLCAESVKERGFDTDIAWVFSSKLLSPNEFRHKLNGYDIILTF